MKIVFLDRDGVINRDPQDGDYIKSWEEFHFLSGAKEAIRKLNDNSFKVMVISNQAGIAKGLYTEEALNKITENMLKEIQEAGGRINSVYYCPHKDEDNCSCRKPKTGLIQKALAELRAKKLEPDDLKQVYVVGDSLRDVQTGKNAGLRTILVLSGKERIEDKNNWMVKPDYIFKDLLEAVDFILSC